VKMPPGDWRTPEMLVMLSAAIPSAALATWMALLNNFAVEQAGFTGIEIGIVQSLREVPGFLGFAAIFLLVFVREQRFLYITMIVLGLGIAFTGYFPNAIGLYVLTVLMSFGYHYHSVVHTSLTLQWIEPARTAVVMGRALAAGSAASIVTFALVWFAFDIAGLNFRWVYALGGGVTVVLTIVLWLVFPRYPPRTEQRLQLVLRSRYWLFYALQFMSGARRQIFVVFAAFLMVERFGFSVGGVAILFLVTSTLNVLVAPRIGRFISIVGERRALNIEYVGLVFIFVAYAFVEQAWVATGLYLIDHLFFALAIAMSTYFQKIADPKEIAATSGVTETVNHIAAVVVPATFGVLWVTTSSQVVFLAGAAMAGVSLILSLNVPKAPAPGNEFAWRRVRAATPAE
jgi:hypothetical protein